MNRRENRNPALVELILVLLFFSLSAMVLVQIFVKAHLTSVESQIQTLGLLRTQDVIEQWKEDPKQARAIFAEEDGWEEIQEQGEFQTYRMICGRELEAVPEEQGAYEMRVNLWVDAKEAGKLYHIQAQVNNLRDERTEVVLTTARYIPEE